ncbi:uncharacterized protein LOC114578865, partial [Dendrobium catenatum]|uniref:uncharacterized protein LOC114578865 n=1 Tax=Dendrobium catenatum TaxID=906689 RepID=UPI00109FC683
ILNISDQSAWAVPAVQQIRSLCSIPTLESIKLKNYAEQWSFSADDSAAFSPERRPKWRKLTQPYFLSYCRQWGLLHPIPRLHLWKLPKSSAEIESYPASSTSMWLHPRLPSSILLRTI